MLQLMVGDSVCNPHTDGVAALANKAIRPGTVLLDIGAGDGSWTKTALAVVGGLQVHCFEPDLAQYRKLLVNLSSHIASGQVVPHHATVGWTDPRCAAAWASLQQIATSVGLKRLPLVRLGTGVPISVATNGCSDLIRHGYLEFLITPATPDEETALAGSYVPNRYEFFRHPALGNQILCVCDRFRATIKNERPQMLDLSQLCQEFGIEPGNLLNLNTQAVSSSDLAAATGGLAAVKGVLMDVNFEPVSGGLAPVEDVDAFLESQGFDRAVTCSAFNFNRGQAFYLRRRPAPVQQPSQNDFLHHARNTLVGGWLNIPTASLREAWEGATGHAHRHLIENGVCQLPLVGADDQRVLELLENSLKTAGKDRRLQLLLALMMYRPVDQIEISSEVIPGWLRKSLPGLGAAQMAMAA